MKKIKKYFSLFLSLTILISLLAGCTSKQKEQTKNSQSQNKPIENKIEYNYADNSFLADPKWLSDNLGKNDILILDARSDKAYKEGHIPGAINVKWQDFANMQGKPGDKGWGVVLEAKELSKKFSEIGVDNHKTIVVYTDNKEGWGEDGRFVWMFRMAGIKNSKMLNGGFNYWLSNGYAVSKEEVKPTPSNFSIDSLDESYITDTEWLKNNLDKVKVLDSRTKEEYDGATKYGEARGGHVKGAILLTFTDVFNADGTVKSQKELEDIFTEAGLSKDDDIVTYCTAGIRSAHLSLILRMAGYTKAKNYDESFYRWAADSNLEIEK